MDGDEALKLLRAGEEGVAEWNRQRREAGEETPDLFEANPFEANTSRVNLSWSDLNRADLGGANLARADLCGTNLSGANLVKANLSKADLSDANLQGAVLGRANLYRAHLISADLKGADLGEADLTKAILREANLSGANLVKANLSEADLIDANLQGAVLGRANLYRADLCEANLRGADLKRAALCKANLSGADLYRANLKGADLSGAILFGADLFGAKLVTNLSEANLSGANLQGAVLGRANLQGANLQGADLQGAQLIETGLQRADLTGAHIYGISAWNIECDEETKQDGLVITTGDEPTITVDDLEVAQFVYLLLKNDKIRHVIDTITSKVVLILGRFTVERKAVLDAIRDELRRRNFSPILLDFDTPASKDVTGTVELLARMARFIIADLTDPSSVPHELATLIPHMRTTPVLLLQLEGTCTYSMVRDYVWKPDAAEKGYPWVLPPHEYVDAPSLIASLPQVIAPADEMAERIRRSKP